MIRSFAGFVPRISKDAFAHDSAEIIGNVVIGEKASVWPTAVLRADVDGISVGARSNIQDGAVVHCRKGKPSRIGVGVTVGHRAIIHGAAIGNFCLIGMGAVVMEAKIGRECIVAAGAVVPAGVDIPRGQLVMGIPGRAVRPLSPLEKASLHRSAAAYISLAEKHKKESHVVF